MNSATDWESRLVCAITRPGTDPWFPGLASELVDHARRRLLEPVGLYLETYGTNRYLRQSILAPRTELHRLATSAGRQIIVEALEGKAFDRYRALGLRQLTKGQIAKARALPTLEQAFRYLDLVPTLRDSVETLVRCIHLLDAGDDSFDVSHSDPEVPHSIFISVPIGSTWNAPLRVCESIVHEAMHLQLTMIENYVDVVCQADTLLSSPWRTDLRPPRGIFHGIYVFSVVVRAFELLLRADEIPVHDKMFIASRIENISNELQVAFASMRHDVLTKQGQALLTTLRRVSVLR